MSAVKRDENSTTALVVQNTLGTSILYPTGVLLTDATALHVAIVDGNGDQITSFGGGTQYTDGGTPPTHPVAPTLVYDNSGTWQHVSVANPLPVAATATLAKDNIPASSLTQAVSVQIVDGSGNQISSFGGGTQYTDAGTPPTHPVGNAFVYDNGSAAWQAVNSTHGLPVSGLGNFNVQGLAANGASLSGNPVLVGGNDGTNARDLSVDTSGIVNINVKSMVALVAGTAVIGHVIVDTAPSTAVTNAGTFAVQAAESDGANVTLGAKADAKSTATDTTSISAMSVLKQISASVQAPPSQAVTNGGTFAVQATPVTQADTFMLGGVNVKEINAVAPLMGAGNGGTGSLRVNIASDQVSIPVAATLSAETTKVIGTVNIASSQTVGLATGSNVIGHVIVDSGTITTVSTVTAVTAITNALPAGTNNIGFVTQTPSTTGGWSVSSQTALLATKTSVKASAATFGGYMFYNPNAAVEYIQVWDVASASVTVGTTAPTYVIPIPAVSAANVEFTNGINHATAIVIAATTTPTGLTAPGSALVGFVIYK